MASGWVKSLHCKSRALEDVYQPNPKHLLPSASCRKSVQSIRDVIDTTKNKPRNSKSTSPKRKPGPKHPRPTKAEPVSAPENRSARATDPYLPA
ncbi:hypothetical protein SLA2020_270280 [Shorea laevis]